MNDETTAKGVAGDGKSPDLHKNGDEDPVRLSEKQGPSRHPLSQRLCNQSETLKDLHSTAQHSTPSCGESRTGEPTADIEPLRVLLKPDASRERVRVRLRCLFTEKMDWSEDQMQRLVACGIVSLYQHATYSSVALSVP